MAADPKLVEFFKQHGGRRLDIADNQPIERGMTTGDLRDWLAEYQRMLTSGARPNGERLTADEGAEIATQAARLRAELSRRERSDQTRE